MPQIKLNSIYYSVGQFPLLNHVDYSLQAKQRVALIGRNGQGKSTLMKIIAGQIEAESGQVEKDTSTVVAMLGQDLPLNSMTVYEFVAKGLAKLSQLLVTYHNLTHQSVEHDDSWMQQLNDVQQQIEALDGWDIQLRIEKALEELKLPADAKLEDLSGGWRRKAALAQVFVQQPDILLLDEPTNHLDLDSIEWLEKRLINYPNTILFVTHDRALLRKLATQILELDRGKLVSYPPEYDTYLQRKEKALEDELKANALFDKRLAEEEKWIRQGIKARRTRNEGRVRALKALRQERKLRQEQQGKATISAQETQKAGKMIIQAEDISFGYADKPIIEGFSFNIQRGDKIAIVGPNGAGKTTLVKLLLQQLEPQKGTIKHSPTNQIAFFDQAKQSLNPEQSLIDNVAEGDDFVEVHGKRKHIIGYLGEFLFEPAKCHGPVKVLSGGEKSRLLLAKLFSKPANVYVLDEPTNDLDIETLEILESILQGLQGCAIVISHDREFIDNVATHTIAIDANGVDINVGGYSDAIATKTTPAVKPKTTAPKAKKTNNTQKLSYNEQRELDKLPEKVENLERDIESLHDKMAAPDFYQQDEAQIKKLQAELKELEASLSQAYSRWEALEEGKA